MPNIQFSMKEIVITFCFSFLTFNLFAQSITQKLQNAFTTFEKDSQLKYAISSLYVIDAKTGQVVFDKNSRIGLAPASTQKIITSVTAFELLGKDYRYKTEFGYIGNINDTDLFIKGSFDPTFGSWRWKSTKEDSVISRIIGAIKKMKVRNYGSIVVNDPDMEGVVIPDGWIWQDIGNYYGAGAESLNWRENQFDLILKSGIIRGEKVSIADIIPKLYSVEFTSYVTAAGKGTGDNAYIYLPIGSQQASVRGTIPVGEDRFSISGAIPSGRNQFLMTLTDSLKRTGVLNNDEVKTINKKEWGKSSPVWVHNFHTEYSPTLDSIIYWFLKKSINLYGEALVKTFAYEKAEFGSTDTGVAIVKKFWKGKGMDEYEIGIVDGSGLSPLNRVTTHSQVEILKYAKTKDWFSYFQNALPEYNGMTMKSGTIHGVKGFCGYHKARNGKEYIFSFLVNNYNGSASALVSKMYKVLDVLK